MKPLIKSHIKNTLLIFHTPILTYSDMAGNYTTLQSRYVLTNRNILTVEWNVLKY